MERKIKVHDIVELTGAVIDGETPRGVVTDADRAYVLSVRWRTKKQQMLLRDTIEKDQLTFVSRPLEWDE